MFVVGIVYLQGENIRIITELIKDFQDKGLCQCTPQFRNYTPTTSPSCQVRYSWGKLRLTVHTSFREVFNKTDDWWHETDTVSRSRPGTPNDHEWKKMEQIGILQSEEPPKSQRTSSSDMEWSQCFTGFIVSTETRMVVSTSFDRTLCLRETETSIVNQLSETSE